MQAEITLIGYTHIGRTWMAVYTYYDEDTRHDMYFNVESDGYRGLAYDTYPNNLQSTCPPNFPCNPLG